MSGAMVLGDAGASMSLDDPQPGTEMTPWITSISLGLSGVYAITEQSPLIGTLAILVAGASVAWDKWVRQKERAERAKDKAERAEVARLKEDVREVRSDIATIKGKLDAIILMDSRQNLPRVPRGDGGEPGP